jgi:hypothetical protein
VQVLQENNKLNEANNIMGKIHEKAKDWFVVELVIFTFNLDGKAKNKSTEVANLGSRKILKSVYACLTILIRARIKI